MSEALAERAEGIFCSALKAASPAGSNELLDRECDGDAALRPMVEKLPGAQPDVDGFLASCEDGVAARPPLEELSRAIEETPGVDASANNKCEAFNPVIAPSNLSRRLRCSQWKKPALFYLKRPSTSA